MTHRSDDHTIEDAIDSAIQDMHQQMPRGNRPGARAWNQVAEAAGIPQGDADVVSTSATHHDFTQAEERMRGSYGAMSESSGHLGWTTWVAAALIVAMIGASFWYLQPESGDDPYDSIALAPGTPDSSTLEPLALASPSASPRADEYIPVYGPEFACNVEPLTEEEVYQIVLNPRNAWVAKGAESYAWDSGMSEGTDRWYSTVLARDASYSYVASNEVLVTGPITEAANTFWNCLMTGSAFQVWSLMEPSAVQHEILKLYPVMRDEATLRMHIMEWGPRRYSAALYVTFQDFGNTPPFDASMHVGEEYGSVRIGYNQGEPWRAVVTMVNHPESEWARQYDLFLEIAPDGTWWVSMIFYE